MKGIYLVNKKQSQSGGAHLIIIIVAVVVLILGGLGFAYWKSASDKAAAEKDMQTILQDGIDAVNAAKEDGTDAVNALTSTTPEDVSITCVADKAKALEPLNAQIESLQSQIVTLTATMQQNIMSGSAVDATSAQAEITRITAEITTLQAQMTTITSQYAC